MHRESDTYVAKIIISISLHSQSYISTTLTTSCIALQCVYYHILTYVIHYNYVCANMHSDTMANYGLATNH